MAHRDSLERGEADAPIRLVLADEHPVILDGLATLFELEPEFQVVARCRTGAEVLAAVRTHRPDVLILDLRLPGKDGLAIMRELGQESLDARVVLFAESLDEEEVLEAHRLGVRGVVLKEMSSQLLVQCVRKVHAGGQWLENRSVSRALDMLLRREAAAAQVGGVLTPRQVQILRMVASGLRTKEVADKLAISQGTVKVHLHNVYDKLGVAGRLGLALYAREKGLV